MEAAELIFADRINVAEEALRSPAEIGRMLTDAEGQIGALTDVLGGTCVVGNMCPAKFACIGCAGNAPDPAKRSQVDRPPARNFVGQLTGNIFVTECSKGEQNVQREETRFRACGGSPEGD